MAAAAAATFHAAMSVLHSLEDALFADLPDGRAEAVRAFRQRVDAAALSAHGSVVALALRDGRILLYDARSFDNRHVCAGRGARVAALSFARDTRRLAAGDRRGAFALYDVAGRSADAVFVREFGAAIADVQCCPCDADAALVLFENRDLVLYARGDFARVAGKFTAVAWAVRERCFYAADAARAVHKFEMDGLSEVRGYGEREDKALVAVMVVSHNGKMMLTLNRRGVGMLMDVETGKVMHRYVDVVGRAKYTTAAFDRNDEYVLLGTKNSINQAFVVYNIVTGMITNIFHGANETIERILVHPLRPMIFAQTMSTLYRWSTSKRLRTTVSVPEDALMRENVVYEEREDEFDVGSDDGGAEEENVVLMRDDVMVRAQHMELDDDEMYPEQIKVLPFNE